MNTKIIIGVVVVVLIIAGGVALLNNNASKQTTQTQQSQSSQTPTTTTMGSTTTHVSLSSSGFSPASVTIKAGEKIIWTNNSGQAATVNSDPHPTHTNYPPLNLGTFNNGQSLELVFPKAGTYGYHDHLSPSIRGTVIVQ